MVVHIKCESVGVRSSNRVTQQPIAPHIKKSRGALAALRKHPERLTPKQQKRLGELFFSYPALRPIYDQMQRLNSLLRMRHQKTWQCRSIAPRFIQIIQQLAQSGF